MKVFISYASEDIDFVKKLANDLKKEGLDIWIYEWEIKVGDSIVEKINADVYKDASKFETSVGRRKSAKIEQRKAKEITKLLPDLNKRIEIWGSHGWEHIELDGSYSNSRPAPEVLKAIEDAAKKVNGYSLKGRIERKDASIAIHTRGLEKKEQKEIKDKVVPEWKDIASAEGMSLVRFNGGYELRDKSINKGSVIREIIEKSGKNGIICYIGDDSTDEDAFAELKDRGLSILISYEDPISSNADVKFDSMDELIDFLKRWSRACGGER